MGRGGWSQLAVCRLRVRAPARARPDGARVRGAGPRVGLGVVPGWAPSLRVGALRSPCLPKSRDRDASAPGLPAPCTSGSQSGLSGRVRCWPAAAGAPVLVP